MNYWPLTRALGTNRHGNRPNDTDLSRVSFDLRVLALRDFVDTGKSTVNAGRRMNLESYFRKLAKDGTFTS